MKKFLLTGLFCSAAMFLSVFAQEMPTISGAWEHQPTKTETYLYNSEKFEIGTNSGTQTDSIPETFTDFIYEDDKVTMETSSWLDAEWTMEVKTELYLKNDMKLDSIVMHSYDTVSTMWEHVFKIENMYENDLQSQSRTYSADTITGAWNLFSQTDFEYNNSGYLTDEFVSMYSPDSGKLITTSKTEYFLTEGRRDSSKSYYWVPVLNQWQAHSRTEYMYNNEGMVEEQVRYDVSILTMNWTRTSRTEFMYNTEGYQYWTASYDWDFISNDWVMNSKDSTVFENDTRPLVSINYEKPLTEAELYVHSKTYFSYDAATGIHETSLDNNFMVYPNPATEFISIQTKRPEDFTVRLFNLSGKLVYENSVTKKTTQVPVHHLTDGSYLLKVSSGNSVHSQIVIVR